MGRLTKFDFDFLALEELQKHEYVNKWPVVCIIENSKMPMLVIPQSQRNELKTSLKIEKDCLNG